MRKITSWFYRAIMARCLKREMSPTRSLCVLIVFRSQIVAQGLLATRMQLDLWKLNRHSLEMAPTLDSTEYDQTDLEFELSQRASAVPSGTVPAN